jgi:hypothetical protein
MRRSSFALEVVLPASSIENDDHGGAATLLIRSFPVPFTVTTLRLNIEAVISLQQSFIGYG